MVASHDIYVLVCVSMDLLWYCVMLIQYEQLFIQAYHQIGKLVPEQNSNEMDPLFQLILDQMPPPP
jgi:predicted membrane GTPase involved in stress response